MLNYLEIFHNFAIKQIHMTTNGYLASKPRYEILDGLRGVALQFL